MNPKSGKACTSVEPAIPDEVVAADDADPGKVAKAKVKQIEKQEGKYGSTPTKPFKSDPGAVANSGEADDEEERKTSWVEIELVDEEEQPVPGEKYEITLPDKTVAKGTLDAKGFARVDGVDPGSCKVTFPELDKDAWE